MTSIKDKNVDSIQFRLEFIKDLLRGKPIKPMLNFDDTAETDMFINGEGHDNSVDMSDSNNSHDTRTKLNKKIRNFYEVMLNVGGTLMYIKSGTSGHTFKGSIQDDKGEDMYNYAVKVVAYPNKDKYGSIHDTRRPENAELMMIKLLSYFVVKGQTPHIVLPIGTFNTSITPFTTLIEEDLIDDNHKTTKYKEFVERHKNGEFYDHVSILISEWANRGDLLDFIRKHYKKLELRHWKVIFFQILSTLATIQSKFPTFRHNDMKANNILIHKVSKKKDYYNYTVVHSQYKVPNIGYFIKLWDFDFACIPGIVDNIKVCNNEKWTKHINVRPEQNRYYDMHFFFNTMVRKGFFPQFFEEKCIPDEVKKFVRRVVPPKYNKGKYVHERGRILINDEYLTPDEVLKTDPFFDEFRQKSKNKSESTHKTNKINKTNKTNKTKNNSGIIISSSKSKQNKTTGNHINLNDLLLDYD
jgi:hypothetical protein